MNIKKLVKFAFKDVKDSLQFKIHYQIEKKLTKKQPYFGYIPSYEDVIVAMIDDINKSNISLEKSSFIDIGCGLPIIPKIFDILGCKEYKGLEYNDIYMLLDNDNYLIKGDLLTYDFSKFDILYSYNPIKDGELMAKGIKNIIKTMKPGATFYFEQACCINKPKDGTPWLKKLDHYGLQKYTKE